MSEASSARARRSTLPRLLPPIIVLLACFALHLPACATAGPAWLEAYLQGTLEIGDAYFGVGFASYQGKSPAYEDMQLAKERALDGLSYQFSVTIESAFKESLSQKGAYEEQQIASSLFVTSRNVFSGIQEREKWTDPVERRHWVLVAIDKARADEQRETQNFINEVADRLDNRQEEIKNGIEAIAGLLENNMALYDRRVGELKNLLARIDAKMDATESRERMDYAHLQQAVEQLEESRKKHERLLLEAQNRRDDRIEALIRENRELKRIMVQVAGDIQKNYLLALAADDLRNQAAYPDLEVRITPDRGQGAVYMDGDSVKFLVSASRDCYIKVTYLSALEDGSGGQRRMSTLLFPNAHDRSNRIRAGETKLIGQLGELVIQPPFGRDIVTVMASQRQFEDLEQVPPAGPGGYQTEISADAGKALALRKRGIGVAKQVKPPTGEEKQGDDAHDVAADWIGSDTCFIVTRPRP